MQVRLTDRFVETAKPEPVKARSDYWDSAKGSRLGLRVSNRSKVWLVMYRRASDGKKRRYKLGTYPAMGLAEARKAATAVIAKVDKGLDPAGERETIKAESTFAALSADYIDRYARLNLRSWQEDQRRLNNSILPVIGETRAGQVTEADIIRLHDAVTTRGAPVEANRQIALVRRIYSWAIGKRMVDHNPAARLQWNKERSRDRVLSINELGQFWHGIEGTGFADETRVALRLLLLTGQRAGEIVGARVSEIDLDRATWSIPGDRTKNGLAHNVPLSPWACQVFEQAITNAKDGFVFPARRGTGTMTRRALSRAIARNFETLGLAHFTPHDLRRTVASQMAAAGIDRLVIGKVLNHASIDRDTVTGLVYDRHGYEPEKRRALETWANRLASIVGNEADAEKVVHLR